jgi:lysine-N-methylase
VTPEDVREGISVAELVFVSHVDVSARGPLLRALCRLLLTNRASFLGVLASEV